MNSLLLLPLRSVRWERERVRLRLKVALTGWKHGGTRPWIISYPISRRRRRMRTLHNNSKPVSKALSYMLDMLQFVLCLGFRWCWRRGQPLCVNELSTFVYSLVPVVWENILNKKSIASYIIQIMTCTSFTNTLTNLIFERRGQIIIVWLNSKTLNFEKKFKSVV